jgi:regulator of cell morphogenesis and NO signaling
VVFEKTVSELLDENYVYARALHYLGIDFFTSPNKKISDLCFEKGLDEHTLIRTFYNFDSAPRLAFNELEKYPLPLLTKYLKHNHHTFIKDKLPFIIYLLERLNERSITAILPEFIEDFIFHIYEEEDSTFRYIEALLKIHNRLEQSPWSVLFEFQAFSLQLEFEEHRHGDDFAAIRDLIAHFQPQDLSESIFVKEIRSFDRELTYHSEIENNIFFPKAIALEKEVYHRLQSLSKLN